MSPWLHGSGEWYRCIKKETQSSDCRTSSRGGHFVSEAHGTRILTEGGELEALAGCDAPSDCRIAHSPNRPDELTPAPRRFPILTCSPSRVVCIWCLETRAEGVAAADCRALRIREIGPSNRRLHPQDLQDKRDIAVFTMAADAYLVPETRVCREGRFNMRWWSERRSAIFQRPPGLRLRSLVVFDRALPPARN